MAHLELATIQTAYANHQMQVYDSCSVGLSEGVYISYAYVRNSCAVYTPQVPEAPYTTPSRRDISGVPSHRRSREVQQPHSTERRQLWEYLVMPKQCDQAEGFKIKFPNIQPKAEVFKAFKSDQEKP